MIICLKYIIKLDKIAKWIGVNWIGSLDVRCKLDRIAKCVAVNGIGSLNFYGLIESDREYGSDNKYQMDKNTRTFLIGSIWKIARDFIGSDSKRVMINRNGALDWLLVHRFSPIGSLMYYMFLYLGCSV